MTKSSEAAATFANGQRVVFRTASKAGVSVERKGTVQGLQGGKRGSWLVIAEDGAAEGVVVRTRASLVAAE